MRALTPALAVTGWLVLNAFGAARAEEPTRVEVTKDNSIVLFEGEWRDNAGGRPQIRIKGNQHLVAMMFDTKPLQGRLIRSATLVCCKGDADIRGLTLSTIQCDWDEMKSSGLASGFPVTSGDPSRRGADGWGYPGARFPAVMGGNAFSLLCQSPSAVKDGAYHWEVQPDLLHAIALGAAWGLALHEWDADYSRNPTIFSREQSAKKPYLLVTFGGEDPKPEPPTDLRITGRDLESLRLHLKAPRSGFAYEVTVSGTPLPRWNIPFVRPGEVQVIPIRDLPVRAGQGIMVAVTTVGRTGRRAARVSVAARAPAAKAVDCPAVAPPAGAGAPPEGLSVIPEEDKYDAAGKAVGDLAADYLARNEVFDGKTIRLRAARGEVVGFQALLRGSGKVTVKCELPGLRTEVYRAVYVACEKGRRIPDPLVGLGPSEEIPLSAEEATPVLVDVFVPFEFKEREVQGALAVSDGRKVPIRLEVRNFAIPREASFFCEMNGYGLPDKVSEFYRLQEIAYGHRVHVNLLPYSQSTAAPGTNKCNISMLMDYGVSAAAERGAGPAARRMDLKRFNDIQPGAKEAFWDDFLAAFGPYLSGTHFKDGHRGPIQPPGFYLPFHDSWPLKVREFMGGSPDAYEAFKEKPVYAETFVSILQDFLRVAREQGWTKTGFQVYLNNKGKLADRTKAPWTLDEPVDLWDYRALACYGDLVRQARGEACPVTVRYRIDISRPEFDRGQLGGKADLWVLATGPFHESRRLVADRAERTGERIWIYGTTNKVEETNRTVQAWVLDAYRGGARGALPWQTISRDGSAMTKADQLGLFIFTKTAAGEPVIHHSMRLKAYRRAQQDTEYLELLGKKLDLTPGQIRAIIDERVNLVGKVRSAYAEDAGTPEYAKATPESLRQLREAVAAALGK